MKIALCLSGYFDSLKDTTSRGHDGHAYIKKHILDRASDDCEVDVFYHNWEPHLEEEVAKLYEPKLYTVETQIDFVKVAEAHGVSRKDLDPYGQLGNWSMTSKQGAGYVGPERLLSQYYSTQKSFELKKQYEEEHGFTYDCVIKARFDLGRINRATSGPGKQNPFACQCINFDPNLDMSHLYMVYWDLFNEGPADMWFYSSSENMDYFCHLYDKVLREYLPAESEYSIAATTGWPESCRDQFRTNEVLKAAQERSQDLHRYPPFLTVNGILLMKWFLMDTGLWNKAAALHANWE
ncbi:MAG TPA: hypothetical protein EYN38_03100 [Flavobacteriales bacterium]|nr:hypothetical protein [Flavobacteriales bacterium]